MKKSLALSRQFVPGSYDLHAKEKKLIIRGKKIGVPSKRISLHQKGLKITKATIKRRGKAGEEMLTPIRINHLPTFEIVRLHSSDTLFPGIYEIELYYDLPAKFNSSVPSRLWLPSIDESDAWTSCRVEIKS